MDTYLYILFRDGRLRKFVIRSLTLLDSSTFYFERVDDPKNKGKKFKLCDIDIFDVSISPIEVWENKLKTIEERCIELKLSAEFYNDVMVGNKRFEVRYNDRDYKVGDILCLREYVNGYYTGRELLRRITYVLNDERYCKESFVILSLEEYE